MYFLRFLKSFATSSEIYRGSSRWNQTGDNLKRGRMYIFWQGRSRIAWMTISLAITMICRKLQGNSHFYDRVGEARKEFSTHPDLVARKDIGACLLGERSGLQRSMSYCCRPLRTEH